jgi:hypothetical protein
MESEAVLETVIKRGLKYDGGKEQAALPFIDFPDAINMLTKVSTMGAIKYEKHSWREVDDKESRYNNARARHFLQSYKEDLDDESGYLHLIHEAWNCLALAQLKLEQK